MGDGEGDDLFDRLAALPDLAPASPVPGRSAEPTVEGVELRPPPPPRRAPAPRAVSTPVVRAPLAPAGTDAAAAAERTPVAAPVAVPESAPPSPPTPAPSRPEPARRPRERRVGWRRRAGAVALALVVVLVAVSGVAWSRFRSIERITLGGVLAASNGPVANYLVVGTDSRGGIGADNALAGAILGDGTVAGERTDTILVLQVGGASPQLLSLPRDLLVPIAGTGVEDRINSAYGQEGPQALIATVQDGLGIPVHHYVEVDLAGFLDLVDAAGGVTIDFDAPAQDTQSGLLVDRAGPVRLDGDQALAYVRSRHYERLVDGAFEPELRGDLDRVVRQQTFLRAVTSEVLGTRNPLRLYRVSGAAARSLRIDDQLGPFEAIGVARSLRGFDPQSAELDVVDEVTADGAAVLRLGPAADETLARFRNPSGPGG